LVTTAEKKEGSAQGGAFNGAGSQLLVVTALAPLLSTRLTGFVLSALLLLARLSRLLLSALLLLAGPLLATALLLARLGIALLLLTRLTLVWVIHHSSPVWG